MSFEKQTNEDESQSRRVLVVDDDASNLGVMRALLVQAGCVVSLAENGREGLAAAAEQSFDVAFIDMHLPDGHGSEVVTSIRHNNPEMFIVMATMDDDPRTLHGAYAAGCDMFLVKPYDVTQIIELAKTARRGRRWISDRFGTREYIGK